MKTFLSVPLLIGALGLLGCAKPAETDADGDSVATESEESPDSGTGDLETDDAATDDSPAPPGMAAVHDARAQLTPENTSIRFVGLHADPDNPNPRTGGFEQFSGTAQVNTDSNQLESVAIEIDTTSIWTQIDRLTEHLKSADFFSVQDYPTAKFASTKIDSSGDGQTQFTGNLTLLDTTKQITFPADVQLSEDGLSVDSEFTIKRTEFGMDFGTDRVVDEVTLMIRVGQKTEKLPPQQPGGGRGGRRGGGGDPSAIFREMDADEDGKLTGEEIPDRMRERLERIDADGDGSISLEELQALRRRGRAGSGGPDGERQGGGGQDQQDNRPERPQRPDTES